MILALTALQMFVLASVGRARLEGGQSAVQRRLLGNGYYKWHEATVKALHHPVKNSPYQYFGNSISSYGNLVMIGAPGDNVMNHYGAVSIYNTNNWELVDFLKPENGDKGDSFGAAVSMSGWDALIGAHKSDGAVGGDMGLVYYYSSSNGESWSNLQQISPVGGSSYDYFGSAVSIYYKNKAAIGAWGSDEVAGGGGIVYTYRMVDSKWSQYAKLVSPEPADFQWYGGSLAVNGHTLAIGAIGTGIGGSMAGAVYVYSDYSTYFWELQKKLYGQEGDNFGKSVAVDGDILAIGAPSAYKQRADYYDPNILKTGRVDVYRVKNYNNWYYEESLVCSDCGFGDVFGLSVDVNTVAQAVVVGKKKGAYVYQYDDTRASGEKWDDETILAPPANMVKQDNSYGIAVALSATTAFVGSRDETGIGGTQSGLVFAFNGFVTVYDSALEALLQQEITIYEILYGIIALGLAILVILPIIMIAQIIADNMRNDVRKSLQKDNRPLIK